MIPFDASGAFRHVAEGGELRRLALRGAAATVSAGAVALATSGRHGDPGPAANALRFRVVAMVITFSLLLMSIGTSGFSEAVIQPEEMNRFQAHAIC
jgi:hypothetical protein